MLQMRLCDDSARIESVCRAQGVAYGEGTMLYIARQMDGQSASEVGWCLFSLRAYELTVYHASFDGNDPGLFDFLIKAVLGYGEQHLALDVTFENTQDEALLVRFRFIPRAGAFHIRLYEAFHTCKNCAKD